MSQLIKKMAIWLIRYDLEKIREKALLAGIKKGDESGYARGFKEGRQIGYDEGKSVFVLEDARTVNINPTIDNSIYGPRKFHVSHDLSEQMKEAVATAVSEGSISPPTQAQWDMILSDHPVTCVVAGAGSGKSTTLVLRVVFMHCYLNIPLSDITVISFTRDSCKELREKIYKVLKLWRHDLRAEQVKNLVRTFHSALSAFGRDILGRREWFDLLKSNDENLITEDIDIDNPLSSGKLNTAQKILLNDAYIHLFNENDCFKEHMISLLKLSILSFQEDKEAPKQVALNNAASRDLCLAKKLNEVWTERGLWPIEGVTAEPVECVRTRDGRTFYANGIIKATGEPVFLTGGMDRDYFFDKKELFYYTTSHGKEESFSMISCISIRNKILAWGCDKTSVFLDSTSKLTMLKYILSGNVQEAPFFDIKLNGELTETNIVEAFYQQASFIESMGMEVTYAMNAIRAFKDMCVEYHFSKVLPIFWSHFEKMIDEKGYITFNRAFLILSNPTFLKKNRTKLLSRYSSLRHLLIDEFQDISPQITMWLKAVQQELARQEQEPSIMAIGDDWQSIYSWRGSSPEIFMNFPEIFAAHESLKKCKVVAMMDNFRSDSKILYDAELLMKSVRKKIDKTSRSCRRTDGDESGVEFIDYDPDDERWVQNVVRCIQKQVLLVSKQTKCDKNKVIVLSRTNSTLKRIFSAGRFGNDVVFHTIHTAKGLQGEVAVILEDSRSLIEHRFRNRIYEIVDFFSSTYDEAMKDEALRLAYVAVTRGVKRVFWFAPQKSTGAYHTMKTACVRADKLQ